MTPADLNQCQAGRPNKTWSALALGPASEDPVTGEKKGGSRQQDRMWRCRAKPEIVIEEATPGPDGLRGEMSLCLHCFGVLTAQGIPHRVKSPEVWIDHDAECFAAWGHHSKAAMMAAAKAHVLEVEGPSDWEVYEEDLEHSPVKHRWAYMADGSDPEQTEEQFHVSTERQPSSKPITWLNW